MNYSTINDNDTETRTQHFVTANQPEKKISSAFLCCSQPCSPTLTARFILRNAIPLLLGMGAGLGAGQANYALYGPGSCTILSDTVCVATTLISTYLVDYLLNCCWPTTPYRTDSFFQPPTHHISPDTTNIPMESIHDKTTG